MVISVLKRFRSPQGRAKRRRECLAYRVFARDGRDITRDVQKVDGRRHVALVLLRDEHGKAFLYAGRHEIAKAIVYGVKLRRKKAA